MVGILLGTFLALVGTAVLIQELIAAIKLGGRTPLGVWVVVLSGEEAAVRQTLRQVWLRCRLGRESNAGKLVLVQNAVSPAAREAALCYCRAHHLPLPVAEEELWGTLAATCKNKGSAVQ